LLSFFLSFLLFGSVLTTTTTGTTKKKDKKEKRQQKKEKIMNCYLLGLNDGLFLFSF